MECLDGLRGLAALWVLVGHCMILTGFLLPILGEPDLGVDLFIMLSGFLMVFQYSLRKEKEDWGAPAAWTAFWIRRFFRLSPLYFFLLVIALLAGEAIYADRVVIDTFLGNPLQLSSRYEDASLLNHLMHVTYLFGLVPDYAFRTPLPDWSLGLEMQFYAVFPFLVLIARRWGWLATAVGIGVLFAGIAVLATALGFVFPMPSFLPLKMHIFLAGMLLSAAIGQRKGAYLVLALALAALPVGEAVDWKNLAMRELMVVGFFALVHWRSLPLVDRTSQALGARPFHWLGELSYGAYLIHLLVAHRAAAWTMEAWGTGMDAPTRFLLVLAVVAPVVYGLALLTYFGVERPGQALGKALLLKYRGKPMRAVQTPAEKIAAP